MDWQPKSFEHLKGKLNFSINCYGKGDVTISDNKAKEFDQIDCLSEVLQAYSNYHIENKTGMVTCKNDQFDNVEIFEEDNYWKTGYQFQLVKNNTDEIFVMSHSHLAFKNGLVIKPKV